LCQEYATRNAERKVREEGRRSRWRRLAGGFLIEDQTVFDKALGCRDQMSMNTKILVVDDEQAIRDSLAKMLRAEGYEIVLAENGQAAIEKLGQEPFSLLLLDLGLPLKDGWTTLKWLNEVNPVFPVIVITGRWKQGELAEAAGADVLMEKPLDVPRLLQNIRELVEEPAEARARRIRDRKRNFQHVPCDSIEFREELQKRYTTPYQFDEHTESKHQEYEKENLDRG